MLLFTKPRLGPGAGCSRADEWKGKGAGKDKDSSPGSRLPLRTHGASTTRRTRGPRPSPELIGDISKPDISPAFPGHPKPHKISSFVLQS